VKPRFSSESCIKVLPGCLQLFNDGQRLGAPEAQKSKNGKRSRNVHIGRFPCKLAVT